MKKPKLYIGTAGWSYNDWVPIFYPKTSSKGFDYLQFYASYFNVVEVNSSYYRYWEPKNITNWINKVKDVGDFVFTFKLHEDFTRLKRFTNENIKSVEDSLYLLASSERLGGLLLQFPYSFECNDSNIAYLGRLLEIFADYPKFVEVKHPSWRNKKAKSTLGDTRRFCFGKEKKDGYFLTSFTMQILGLHGHNSLTNSKSTIISMS